MAFSDLEDIESPGLVHPSSVRCFFDSCVPDSALVRKEELVSFDELYSNEEQEKILKWIERWAKEARLALVAVPKVDASLIMRLRREQISVVCPNCLATHVIFLLAEDNSLKLRPLVQEIDE